MPDTLEGISTIPTESVREKLIGKLIKLITGELMAGEDFAKVTHCDVASYQEAVRLVMSRIVPFIQERFYLANMPNILEVNKEFKNRLDSKKSVSGTSPLHVNFLAKLDAKLMGHYACFENAVIQVAGQANGTENTAPVMRHPVNYAYDASQGPAAQMLDAVAAVARCVVEYLAGNYSPINEDEDIEKIAYTCDEKPREEIGCDSLADWRRMEGFYTCFEVLNGYIHPIPGKEEEAVAFLRQHISKLRVNVEKINPYGDFNKSMVQVITFAFALGAYDHPQFDLQQPPHTRNAEQQKFLETACEILLNAQYEMIAQIAIIKAILEPHKPIPLVLTRVGAGAFKNPTIIVDNAIKVALETIQNSGIQNIEVYISAFAPEEMEEVRDHLNLDPLFYQTTTLTPNDLEALVPPKEASQLATSAPLSPTQQPPSIPTLTTAQPFTLTPEVNSATAVPLLTREKDLLFTMADAPVFQVGREKASEVLKNFYHYLVFTRNLPEYKEKLEKLTNLESPDIPGKIELRTFSYKETHSYIIFVEKGLYVEFKNFMGTKTLDNASAFFTPPSVQGSWLEETAAMKSKEEIQLYNGITYSDVKPHRAPSREPASEYFSM